MRTSRGRLYGLACLGLALVAFLLIASRARATQFDPRQLFVYDLPGRTLRQTAPGRWTEFINGRPARRFDELGRTPEYVELYTEAPVPTWVRIHPRQVFWRVPSDPVWRAGQTGSWASD